MSQFALLIFAAAALIAETQCQKGPRISSLYACTDIKYRFATTRITNHVTNPTNQTRRAAFDVTLPNDAFISNFTLEVGGQVYAGRVEERLEALTKFGGGTEDQSSSAEVTQRPRETNKFRVVIKVGPQKGVTFNLTYQEILERRLGTYDHVLYIDPGQPVSDMRVDVSIEENREITYLHVPPIRSDLLTDFNGTEQNSLVRVERPSDRQAFISYRPSPRHQQMQGRSRNGISGLFTVRYDVNRTMDAGELLSVNGFFIHFIAPTVEQEISKNVLFILDTSTSMMYQKLAQLQEAMRVILSDMSEKDRFALMQFNSRATFWRRQLLPVTPDNIEAALQYVGALKARGYTNIDSALAQGLQFFNDELSVKGENSLIIFLTDGRPTRGETDGDLVLKNVLAQNQKNAAIYGLAFGKDADWPLVKRLVSQNKGVGRRIYQDADSALQIQGFFAELSTLLLTDVHAVYLENEVDLASLTRTAFSKFFNGSELLVAGRLIRLNQTTLQVLVQASGVDGNVNLTVVPDPDPVTSGQVTSCKLMDLKELLDITEKMWGYLTIRQILQQRLGEDDSETKKELRKKAVELAMQYKFVTPVTSMIVRKPGSEEVAFLQEDASDLLDEIDDVFTPPNITEAQNTSTSGRGGGGGDPHFMIELGSLPYPVCYDVSGKTGDVFRLLRDPETGLTVNVQLSEGTHLSRRGQLPVFMTKVAVLLQDVIMEVTPTGAKVDDLEVTWNMTRSVRTPGVWVTMENATLRFVLDWGVEIDVTRHVIARISQQNDEYLNVEIQHEEHLSPQSTGLLGQFHHKSIRLAKLKRRDGRVVAELDIMDGAYPWHHGRAVVKQRRDPFFHRLTPCLMVDTLWSKTLDHPTRFYQVDSLYSVE